MHPRTLQALDLKGTLVAFEIVLDALPLPKHKPTKAKADSAVGKAKKVSGRKPMTSRKPSAKTQPAKKPSPPAKKGFQMPKMDDFKLPF